MKALLENSIKNQQNIQNFNDQYDEDDLDAIFNDDEKRSLSTLARNGGLRSNGAPANKRNVGAMARLGLLRPVNQDEIKRSIATLAKNGQLPSREPEPDDDLAESQWMEYKRNIGSLARSGNIGGANPGSGKRNIAALARDYELPSYGKRNLPSILRASGQPRTNEQPAPKRNIAALARDGYYQLSRNEKRDIHGEHFMINLFVTK